SGAKRRGCEATLQRVFGVRMSPRRRRTIVRGAFDAFWSDMFTAAAVPVSARLVGGEHLRQGLNDGHGAVVWISNNYAGTSRPKSMRHRHGIPMHKAHAGDHLDCMAHQTAAHSPAP